MVLCLRPGPNHKPLSCPQRSAATRIASTPAAVHFRPAPTARRTEQRLAALTARWEAYLYLAASSITGVRPPDGYGADVWELLVAQGRLRDGGHGLLEPAGDPTAG